MTAPPIVRSERRHGDFLIRFMYVNTTPHIIGSEHEACIAIRRPESSGMHAMACVFLSAIHQYVENGKSGGPSQYCFEQALFFANLLGLTPDRNTVFRLCEAILDSVADLYDMPPYIEPLKVIGEVDANFGGTKISTELYQ